MELSEQQKEIIETDANKVIVVASAAAGKTTVLVERVKYLLRKGVAANKIVLITFTNAAAGELGERLGNPKGVFIGTVHSYANYLLLSKGEDTNDLLEQELFNKLFDRIKDNPSCVRPVEHLLLDESQDSTPEQFEFLLDIVKPKNYMLVGDWRQSIYRWLGAYPDYLISLSKELDVTTYNLNDNYRNGYKILDFARNIIRRAGYDYRDESVAARGIAGKVNIVDYVPIVIARAIKQAGNYGEWFVLTRTNQQLDEISYYLKKEGVPIDTFKRSELDNKELGKKMEQDTVKVLTIHTAKGLEANNVVVIGAKFYDVEEKCVSYVAATRARNLLVWAQSSPRKNLTGKITKWET